MKYTGKPAIPTISPDDLKVNIADDLKQACEQIKSCLATDDLAEIRSSEDSAVCLYLDTIIDETRFYKEISSHLDVFSANPENWRKWFPSGKRVSRLDQAIDDGLSGHVLLLHPNLVGIVLSIPLMLIPHRAIEEPKVEKIVIGPKDSFIEDFKSNLGLMRRWVRDPNLSIRYFQVGRRSKSKVALCYLKDIANPDWIKEIETRLESIDVDFIVGHTDVMNLLIRRTLTPFPLYQLTEIPARCQFEMSVGRIVLIVEGSPYGVVLPAPLIGMFREAEYLLQSGIVRTFARLLRFIASFLSMYSAAIYVALVSVNTSILPTEISLAISRDQLELPYPTLIEVLLILVVMDIFIEGTTYVPGSIGPAMNIVGSLILGQAATQAHLVSSLMIIVSSITAIGNYISAYQFSYAIRIWKYLFVLSAAFFGIFGIMTCMLYQVAHLSGLKTLGVPYLKPFAPLSLKGILQGGLFDADADKRMKRPELYGPMDKTSQKKKGKKGNQ